MIKIDLVTSIGLILMIISSGFFGFSTWKSKRSLENANAELNKQLMESNLELGRAKTEFGNANKHIKELEENIQKEIKERKAIATSFAQFKARLTVTESIKDGSVTIIGNTTSEFVEPGLYLLQIDQVITYLDEVITGYQDHRIGIGHILFYSKENNKLSYAMDYILDLSIEGQLVETHTPSGAVNHYISLWETDKEGKRIQKLKLEKFNVTVQKPKQKQLFWFNPKLDISAAVLIGKELEPKVAAVIGLSLSAYGLTKNDLDYRFLRFSLDFKDELGIGFSPVQFNLGTLLPIISNLWIGPHLNYDLKSKNYSGGFSIGANF